MSVSEKSWDVYNAGFTSGTYAEDGCFGCLMNEIPEYPASQALNADIWFQPDRLRPRVIFHESGHPLFVAQRDGIELAQVERWAAMAHSR